MKTTPWNLVPAFVASAFLLGLAPIGACNENPKPDPRIAALQEARVKTAQLGLAQIANAIDVYRVQSRDAPKDLDVLEGGKFIARGKLADPWGTKFRYRPPAKPSSAIDLCSAGPDKRFDSDDDICHQTPKAGR